jgi:hypothetical protein
MMQIVLDSPSEIAGASQALSPRASWHALSPPRELARVIAPARAGRRYRAVGRVLGDPRLLPDFAGAGADVAAGTTGASSGKAELVALGTGVSAELAAGGALRRESSTHRTAPTAATAQAVSTIANAQSTPDTVPTPEALFAGVAGGAGVNGAPALSGETIQSGRGSACAALVLAAGPPGRHPGIAPSAIWRAVIFTVGIRRGSTLLSIRTLLSAGGGGLLSTRAGTAMGAT